MTRLTAPAQARASATVPVDVMAGDQKRNDVQGKAEQLQQEAVAVNSLFVHRGPEESLDVVHFIVNPISAAALVNVEIVGYTVPNGMIAYIDKIAVVFSSVALPQTLVCGWRMTLGPNNIERVPNILDPINEYFYYSLANIDQPKEITPVWVQSNKRVSLMLTLQPLFNDPVTVIGRISGKIIKPASPALLGRG